MPRASPHQDHWRKYLPLAQWTIGIGGLCGAILHAFPISEGARLKENWPVVDAVDIGWIALIAVAVLLPGISKLTLGSVSVEMREQALESKAELEEVVEDYANLVQNWSTSALIYIEMVGDASDDNERAILLSHYLRDRMGEAKNFLSSEPTDDVRIALWMFDENTRLLEFFFSNERPPVKQSYGWGEGMVGQAFVERRGFNEPDVRNVPSYVSTRDGDPPYRAVLCLPVTIGDEPIGMLTADKKTATLFSAAAEEVAKGLASQCALAIDQFRKAD